MREGRDGLGEGLRIDCWPALEAARSRDRVEERPALLAARSRDRVEERPALIAARSIDINTREESGGQGEGLFRREL